MSKSDDIRKNYAVAEMLSLCTGPDLTTYTIESMYRQKFTNDAIQSFIKLKESQISNEKECQRKVLKGEFVKLPPQDPIVAMAESQKRAMAEFAEPMTNLKIDLVMDAKTENIKGYQFSIGDTPLEQWCEDRGLNFGVYQTGLQAYIEVDILGKMNVAIMNNQLVYIDPNNRELKVLTYDELSEKLNNDSRPLNDELAKLMKDGQVITNNGSVVFELQQFGKTKTKIETQSLEESPKPGMD